MKLLGRFRQKAADRERIASALEEIALNLRSINAHLSYSGRIKTEKAAPPKQVTLPQPIIDAAELLARKIWLELPEEAKEDLSS